MTPRSASQARGRNAERRAEHFLISHGLVPVQRNYHGPRGEIDLVMREGSTLVFIEVRYRASARFGSGAETVDSRKQSSIRHTAEHFLQSYRGPVPPCRFDVLALTGTKPDIEWIQDAF